ncbi:hypothetical protein A0H81_14538 [Grifola frondosa]|uniref:F-box domain-containing protein n=1 Tax=Grifola frondosa TaxID=5627 RepID=A0A1C7LLM7_GRIFR|nr:hypothetical protein A0H81_14538 [Grifola frondosa]
MHMSILAYGMKQSPIPEVRSDIRNIWTSWISSANFTIIDSKSSANEIRSQLDAGVQDYRQLVNDLLTQTARLHAFPNSLTPLHCLADELLSEIIPHLLQAPHTNSDLISVTHVCRRWRAAAIRDPNLWTSISLNNPTAAAEFFRRSGSMRLRVSLTDYISPYPTFFYSGAAYTSHSYLLVICASLGRVDPSFLWNATGGVC